MCKALWRMQEHICNQLYRFKQSRLIIIQDSTTNKAIVQWQFVEQLKWYPWQRLGSMMNEAVMGSQLETNLANLKKLCEPQ